MELTDGEWESSIEYGHLLSEVGWVIEPRGKNYATHQRIVYRGPVTGVILDWSF